MKVFRYDQVDWDRLFAPQTGGSRFRGYPYQRGGSWATAALRIVPAILGSPVGKELVTGALGTALDIRQGVPPLTAMRNRGRQAIRKLVGVGRQKDHSGRKRVIREKSTPKKRPLFVPAL